MKIVSYINMIGVGLLAILCTIQWQTNRRVSLLAVSLDKTRQEQAIKIAEQARAIKGYASDLEDFRARLEKSEAALKQVEGQIVIVTADRDRNAAERDRLLAERNQLFSQTERLKVDLARWMQAVAQRDDALKKVNAEAVALGKDRNDAVVRFNDLATKYNGLVKDLDDARKKLAGG